MGTRSPNGGRRDRRTRRPSVVAYLLTAFAVSLATLVVVTAMSTASSFDQERTQAETALWVAAQRQMLRLLQQTSLAPVRQG